MLRLIAKGAPMVMLTIPADEPENTTVATTINAAGDTLSPLIIFGGGERVQAAWMAPTREPKKARYSATETSFMEENVLLNYLKDFEKQLRERGLLDGTPHLLVLGDRASPVTVDALQLAKELNFVLFALPSRSLNVASFGTFEKKLTEVLASFSQRSGGRTPVKADMVAIKRQAWTSSFSKEENIKAFAGAGLWPVDAKRAKAGL